MLAGEDVPWLSSVGKHSSQRNIIPEKLLQQLNTQISDTFPAFLQRALPCVLLGISFVLAAISSLVCTTRSFFTGSRSFFPNLCSMCPMVRSSTFFTVTDNPVFIAFVSSKFLKRFSFVTFGASFLSNYQRSQAFLHLLFLFKTQSAGFSKCDFFSIFLIENELL